MLFILDELYGDTVSFFPVVVFLHFLPRRTMLEHCPAVKLQKYFVDCQTSPDFSSARGEDVMIELKHFFFFWLTAPLISFQDITGDPHTNTDSIVTKVPSLL